MRRGASSLSCLQPAHAGSDRDLREAGVSDNHGIPLSVATCNGLVTAKNGFNCTQGQGGYETPCSTERGAFVRILANSRRHPNQDEGEWVPLYLNFFMGFQEEYASSRPWRPGDAARIKSVRLEVRRFTPATP